MLAAAEFETRRTLRATAENDPAVAEEWRAA